MSTRRDTRTLRPPVPPVARVQDPGERAVFRALARALSMGLETERARNLIAATIAARCAGDEIDAERWHAEMEVERLERETLGSLAAVPWRPGKLYELTGQQEAS